MHLLMHGLTISAKPRSTNIVANVRFI